MANGGKMLAKDARQKMRMSKQAFTNLLAVLPDIESKPPPLIVEELLW
jgi:hypothetical protein